MLYTAYAQDMQEAYPQMTDKPFGHNGGPAWRPPSVVAKSPARVWVPPDVAKPHFFKCDIEALRRAIFDKPLDIRGAFISALLAMYEFGEPLPADDNIARMRCGIMDMRVYRRVKREMVAMGLMFVAPSGELSNARFEEEISKYVTEFQRRRGPAKERDTRPKVAPAPLSKPDQLSPSYRLAKPELAPSYALASPELSHDLSEKTNEINDPIPSNHPVRARVLELELDSNSKKNPPTPQNGGHPPPEIPKLKKGPSRGDALTSFESYNAVALRVGLQQAVKMTPDRERKIIARLRDYGSDGWATAMSNLERSKFLTGQIAFKGQDAFRANLDFVLQPTSFGKLIDGSYGTDRPVRVPMQYRPPSERDKFEPGSQEWLLAVDREFAEADAQIAAKKANK